MRFLVLGFFSEINSSLGPDFDSSMLLFTVCICEDVQKLTRISGDRTPLAWCLR
jgi:hypothetical protein